jgi:RNA polymerase sigma-70 factor (ECF subfamily)
MMIQADSITTDAAAKLIARVAVGDRNSFKDLYQLTSPRLFAMCLRLLRVRELAEEALQDAFIKIWNSAATYRSERGTALGWLSRIVRNQCLDYLRYRRVEAVHHVDSHGDGDEDMLNNLASADQKSPEQLAEAASDNEHLARCLQALKSKQQELISVAYTEGLSHSELAHRFTLPLGTVKSLVRRALLSLKVCLERGLS